MENIEQLKADNAKLTERLNNAAKFFREQKDQIEKLNNTINSKDQAYKVLQDTYNEVFAENEQLKNELESISNSQSTMKVVNDETQANYEVKYNELYEQLKDKDVEINNYKDALDSCTTQLHDYEQMTNNLQNDNNIKETQIKELSISKEEIQFNLNEQKKNNESLVKMINDYKEAIQENELKYQDLKTKNENLTKELSNKDEQIQTIKNTLSQNKENLNKQLNEYELKLQSTENNLLEEKKKNSEIVETLNNEISLQSQELTQYKLKNQKYEEFLKMIFDLSDSFRNNGNDVLQNNTKLTELPKMEINNQPKNISNSTGNQFMSDAVGLNI